MAWSELEIEIEGGTIAARAWGPPDGRPVLCLHGWLDNAASFETLVPALASRSGPHRFVAIDLPGHGHSSHRAAGASYLFIDAVADVAAVRHALGWSRCVLMGHSLGAAIACCLAGAEPDRAQAVIAIEGLGPMTDDPAQAPTRLAAALEEARSKRGKQPPVHPDLEAAATRLAQGVMRLSLPAARILCARGLAAVDGGVRWRADPRLRWQSRLRLTEPQVIAFLSAIVAPVLFVRAQEGFFFVDGEPLRQRMDCIRALSTVSLPGTHHLHLDAPDPVADAIAGFLAGS